MNSPEEMEGLMQHARVGCQLARVDAIGWAACVLLCSWLLLNQHIPLNIMSLAVYSLLVLKLGMSVGRYRNLKNAQRALATLRESP